MVNIQYTNSICFEVEPQRWFGQWGHHALSFMWMGSTCWRVPHQPATWWQWVKCLTLWMAMSCGSRSWLLGSQVWLRSCLVLRLWLWKVLSSKWLGLDWKGLGQCGCFGCGAGWEWLGSCNATRGWLIYLHHVATHLITQNKKQISLTSS